MSNANMTQQFEVHNIKYKDRRYVALTANDVVFEMKVWTAWGWRQVKPTSAQSIKVCNANGLMVQEKHW